MGISHVIASSFNWRGDYARRLWITDLCVLVIVVYSTQFLWLGLGNEPVAIRGGVHITLTYWMLSAALIVLWMWTLALADTRSDRVIGTGSAEYVRVADSSVRMFGVIAIFAFIARVDIGRGFLLISLPAGVMLLVLARWLWRRWLNRHRRDGGYSARVLLVGSSDSIRHVASELERTPEAGYQVVGACLPTDGPATTISDTHIPVVGHVGDIRAALSACNADTVAVTSTDHLPASEVKKISWALRSGREHLVLAPSIIDIAGPRIHTRPVAGLPLLHVETPRFSAGQRLVKRLFDLVVTGALVLILSPLLLVLAAMVKLTSKGPVLYAQERIGLHGRPFKMLKFRSMRVGADAELQALLEQQGTEQTPLFKIKDDPRITPIGRVIRKYSLDELPQLLNVLGGSMSLVGPRPQIAEEVALYTDIHRRRLLARPGITGLWQVSGRSSLDWDDAVRLDLFYVENWSLAGDVAILARTVNVVIAPGATAH